MKGTGQLILTKENLIEAVQQWVDQRWTVDSPVVTNVKIDMRSVGDGGGIKDFAIIDIQSNKSFVGAREG